MPERLLANPWTVTRWLAAASFTKERKLASNLGTSSPPMQLSQSEAKVLVVKLDSIGEKLADCDPLMSHQGKAQALKAPITHGTLYTWTTNMGAVGNQAGLLSIHEPASVLCTTHSPGFNIARKSTQKGGFEDKARHTAH